MLKPIGDSDEEEGKEPNSNEPTEEVEYVKKVAKEPVQLEGEEIETAYVFRIALKNKSDDHFLVEIKVDGDEESHFTGIFSTFVKNTKKDVIICNLHSKNF